MTAKRPKPASDICDNRRARQIAVSDSVALVLCEDDTLWAYDLLVAVAAWERLPAIPTGREGLAEMAEMADESAEATDLAKLPAKLPAKPAKLESKLPPKRKPVSLDDAPDAETA